MLTHENEAPDARIAWAFRLVTSRAPGSSEVALLTEDLMTFMEQFQSDPQSANKLLSTGEKPYNKNLDAATLAAYTLVANTILNLDESMTMN